MASTTDVGALDPAIEALDLADVARTAAYALKRAHPSVVFTSGRRNKADQARAMASNVAKNRQWIVQTYKASALRARCQQWVDEHPEKVSAADIEIVLGAIEEVLAHGEPTTGAPAAMLYR